MWPASLSPTWRLTISAAFKLIGTCDEPFDRWFRGHVRGVHGTCGRFAQAPSRDPGVRHR
jgi:hypothetical protein